MQRLILAKRDNSFCTNRCLLMFNKISVFTKKKVAKILAGYFYIFISVTFTKTLLCDFPHSIAAT